MKKTNKPQKDLKIACLGLNRILSVKEFSETQFELLVKKLKKFIKNSKPGNVDIIKYVKYVVSETLSPEEEVHKRSSFILRSKES